MTAADTRSHRLLRLPNAASYILPLKPRGDSSVRICACDARAKSRARRGASEIRGPPAPDSGLLARACAFHHSPHSAAGQPCPPAAPWAAAGPWREAAAAPRSAPRETQNRERRAWAAAPESALAPALATQKWRQARRHPQPAESAPCPRAAAPSAAAPSAAAQPSGRWVAAGLPWQPPPALASPARATAPVSCWRGSTPGPRNGRSDHNAWQEAGRGVWGDGGGLGAGRPRYCARGRKWGGGALTPISALYT